MPTITFHPAGVTVEVDAGTSLLDAARRADVPIRNDCGGQGVCGRCLIEVRRGEVQRLPSRHRTPEGADLACRTIAALGDVHFRVHKRERDGETVAGVERVEGDVRLEEIARMAGGESVTDATRRHAAELLGLKPTTVSSRIQRLGAERRSPSD